MNEEFETETPTEDATSTSTDDQRETNMSSEASNLPAAPADKPPAANEHAALGGPSLSSVIDVPLRVNVEIGSTKMLVREVLQLNKGSVVPLDRMSGDPADILVNGRLIARGEVTVLEDSLAVRVVELLSRDQSGSAR